MGCGIVESSLRKGCEASVKTRTYIRVLIFGGVQRFFMDRFSRREVFGGLVFETSMRQYEPNLLGCVCGNQVRSSRRVWVRGEKSSRRGCISGSRVFEADVC